MNLPTEKEVEHLRETYPKGTRIKLNHMADDPHPVPDGTYGVVEGVDDGGQILMRWDNGQSLSLVPDADDFKIAPTPKIERRRNNGGIVRR